MSAAFSEYTTRIAAFLSWNASILPRQEQLHAVELSKRMVAIITTYKTLEPYLTEVEYEQATADLEAVLDEMEEIQEKANRLYEKARLN